MIDNIYYHQKHLSFGASILKKWASHSHFIQFEKHVF